MSQETNNPNTEEKQYTPEEMAQMRKSMIANYKSEITFLKVQAEYEKLTADIEEHKTRRYIALAQAGQIFAKMEQQEEQQEPGRPIEKKERKLKVEENV
tara:strand:+ start:877 stop:1173 length:297 start_codon:yes stop_codon:yes gene_type:complete